MSLIFKMLISSHIEFTNQYVKLIAINREDSNNSILVCECL